MLRTLLTRLHHEEDGWVAFEWIVLLTLVTIGIVGGIATARDAIIDEMGDAAQMMIAVDGSFSIDFPLHLTVGGVEVGGASDSSYYDSAEFEDCGRTSEIPGAQSGLTDPG